MANYSLSTFSGVTPNIYSVFMDQSVNAIAGTSGNGGLYYSSDRGKNWRQGNVTSGTFYSIFMDQSVNAIAGSNNGLWYSSNSGFNWNKSLTGSYNSVFMDESGNAIAGSTTASSKGLYYSSDRGKNWTQSNVTSGAFYSVVMDQSVNAIAVSGIGAYYSSNRGRTWTISNITNLTDGTPYSVVMDQSVNAIVGLYGNGGLYYSSNRGRTWTISNITTGYFNQVFLNNYGNAVAVENVGGGIYYSSDRGKLWYPSNVTDGSFTSVFMNENGDCIAGSYTGLWYSSDFGHIWYPTNVTTSIQSVFMDKKGNRLAVGVATYYYTALVCFKEGTKILTDKGYLPIQDLKKGDLVKTVNNFIPIHAIGKREIYHPAAQNREKDQLYKCSPEHFPVFEDLMITGCHSILVDEFKEGEREKTIEINGDAYVTEKKYRLPACVDERTTVYETPGTYTIYHFALENDDWCNNYGVYANGLLVESCSIYYLKELANMELI